MRSFLISSACAASLMLALAPAASAADVDYAPEAAGPSWYISVFGGWSLPDDIDLSFATTFPSIQEFSAEVDIDNGFLVGLAVGAQVNDWMRGELEVSGHWHDAGGEAAFVTFGSPIPATDAFDLNGDVDTRFLLANVWFDVPIGEKIRPYLGGGVGVGRLDIDVRGTDPTPLDASAVAIDDADWGFAYQLGAGLAFDLTPHMAVDIGYRFKRIHDVEPELEIAASFLLTGASSEVNYTSHNLLLGLRFGF
jgi:opacity protein-like surface antigen